jgi:hypothetical protein
VVAQDATRQVPARPRAGFRRLVWTSAMLCLLASAAAAAGWALGPPELTYDVLAFFAAPVVVAAVPLFVRRRARAVVLRGFAALVLVAWALLVAYGFPGGAQYLPAAAVMALAGILMALAAVLAAVLPKPARAESDDLVPLDALIRQRPPPAPEHAEPPPAPIAPPTDALWASPRGQAQAARRDGLRCFHLILSIDTAPVDRRVDHIITEVELEGWRLAHAGFAYEPPGDHVSHPGGLVGVYVFVPSTRRDGVARPEQERAAHA